MINKWIWTFFILATLMNGAVIRSRVQKYIKLNSELEEGYKKIIKGFIIWGNIPWVVMGIGCTIGDVPSVFYYFNPRSGNPYILAFWGSLFLIWILGSYWMLFKDGASELINHPGILNNYIKSPTFLKLYWIAGVLGGIFAALMIFTKTIPLPNI